MTTAKIKTRAHLMIEVDVGTFGDAWNVASLEKDAKRALDTAIEHLKTSVFKSGITLTGVTTEGLRVDFYSKDQ